MLVGVSASDEERVIAVVPVELDVGHPVLASIISRAESSDLHGAVTVPDLSCCVTLARVKVCVPADELSVGSVRVAKVEVADLRRGIEYHQGRGGLGADRAARCGA